MAESIKPFENSLRDYLINAQTDSYNTVQRIQYRYNNMKLYMDPKKVRTAHFTVSLGISEATIGIDPVELLSGSLGNDTRYVCLWASRPNINGELKKHWLFLTQQTSSDSVSNLDDKEVNKAKGSKFSEERKREEALSADSADFITGTGLKRSQPSVRKQNPANEKKQIE